MPFNRDAIALCRALLRTVDTLLLRPDADARSPAFRALQGHEDPVEKMMTMTKGMITASTENQRMSEATAVVERGGPLLPVEAAWFGDLRARNDEYCSALAQADALVALHRLGRCVREVRSPASLQKLEFVRPAGSAAICTPRCACVPT